MAEKVVEKTGALERKAIIKNADMTEDMQQDAIECASQVRFFLLPPLSSFFFIVSMVVNENGLVVNKLNESEVVDEMK